MIVHYDEFSIEIYTETGQKMRNPKICEMCNQNIIFTRRFHLRQKIEFTRALAHVQFDMFTLLIICSFLLKPYET